MVENGYLSILLPDKIGKNIKVYEGLRAALCVPLNPSLPLPIETVSYKDRFERRQKTIATDYRTFWMTQCQHSPLGKCFPAGKRLFRTTDAFSEDQHFRICTPCLRKWGSTANKSALTKREQ